MGKGTSGGGDKSTDQQSTHIFLGRQSGVPFQNESNQSLASNGITNLFSTLKLDLDRQYEVFMDFLLLPLYILINANRLRG